MTHKDTAVRPGETIAAYEIRMGHVGRVPSNPKPQPKSDLPDRIIGAIKAGSTTSNTIARALGAKKTTVQNQLYKLRTDGVLESDYNGQIVEWHLVSEQVAA